MALAKKSKQKLICPQGKTFRAVMRFNDNNGNIIDLTGYTARIEIRDTLPTETSVTNDDNVIFVLTTQNGGISIDPLLGKVSLFISKENTASFAVASYFWELELISSNGETPYIMAPSAFSVLGEVTL